MPDYQQGKIYRIICETTGLVYIGSTTQTLQARLEHHKRTSMTHSTSSYMIIKNNNYKIELVEKYPCDSGSQLRERERYHITNCECVNIQTRPYRSEEERLADGRMRMAEFRIRSPERLRQLKHNDYIKHRDKRRNTQTEYKTKHREKCLQMNRDYYIANRESLLAKQGEKIECECGCIVGRGDIARHRRTEKHTKKISSKCIDQNATPTQENTQTEIV